MKAVCTVAIFTIFCAVFSSISAEPSPAESQKIEELNERQNEERARLLNLLMAELDSDAANEQEEDSYEPASGLDKRMSYRYGKRMSYRYGKRSAMPYRFGKRSGLPNQEIVEYLNANPEQYHADKRMSYRYGRSVDRAMGQKKD